MKKKYIKLQVECMQIQHENHLLAGSGNENDHADSKEFEFDFDAEFQSDFEADFDNFDDDDINTFKDNKKLWDY